jgi:PKD repeat protein
MKTPVLKSLAVPKIALVAATLASGMLFASVDAGPAQATPSRARDCTGCHGSGLSSTVTARPSTTTPAAGASYTVVVTPPARSGGGQVGFWIANSTAAGATGTSTGVTGGPSSAATFTASMTAPTAAGTYWYKVWSVRGPDDSSGVTNFALYSITVSGAVPAPKPTAAFTASATSGVAPLPVTFTDTSTGSPTAWAWNLGNGTTSTVRNPSVTYTAAGTYTVTLTASNASGTSAPVSRTITVTGSTTPPPVPSSAVISRLSDTRGSAGDRVTISGTGFGSAGIVRFGTVSARVSSWSSTRITVRVPSGISSDRVSVTVTPSGGTASNGVRFSVSHGDDDGDDD